MLFPIFPWVQRMKGPALTVFVFLAGPLIAGPFLSGSATGGSHAAAEAATQAASDSELTNFLKKRPEDRRQLGALLKRYIQRKEYENVYTLALYLRRLGVKGPKILRLIGVAAFKIGRRDQALKALRAALQLDPRDQRAREYIGQIENPGVAFRGPPVPVASSASSKDLVAGASRAFYQDRTDLAMEMVEKALNIEPGDVEASLLKAQIQMSRGEFKTAGLLLKSLLEAHPASGTIKIRFGEWLVRVNEDAPGDDGEQRDNRRAEAYYYFEEGLKLDPDNDLNQLLFVTFLYSLGNPESRHQADAIYARLAPHRPFPGREMIITDANIRLMRDELDLALESLEYYDTTFGADSQSLLSEGLARYRKGENEVAGRVLEQSFRRNLNNLALALKIASILATIGQADKALTIIGLAETKYPTNKQLEDMKAHLKQRVITDRDFVSEERGPFQFHYPKKLKEESPEAFARIFQVFEGVYAHQGELVGARPRPVVVKIHYTTGIDNPAFYNISEDAITISAKYFIKGESESLTDRDQETLAAYAAHMLEHEYAHLSFAHRLGHADLVSSHFAVPLWIQEGVAEWVSGGISDMRQDTRDFQRLFADGFLDYQQLGESMSLINSSRNPANNIKAYVQSFYMVKTLMLEEPDAKDSVTKFVEFVKIILETNDTERALTRAYQMDYRAFETKWMARIRADLFESAVPVLDSRAKREMRESQPGDVGPEHAN